MSYVTDDLLLNKSNSNNQEKLHVKCVPITKEMANMEIEARIQSLQTELSTNCMSFFNTQKQMKINGLNELKKALEKKSMPDAVKDIQNQYPKMGNSIFLESRTKTLLNDLEKGYRIVSSIR